MPADRSCSAMARFHRAPGACPACDRPVPRIVHATGEVFVCPEHGRLEYAQGMVPLAQLGHDRDAMVSISFAQPLTGLELVH